MLQLVTTHLGGDDFDQCNYRLVHVSRTSRLTEGVDLSKDKMAMQRLKEAAEKAKKELIKCYADKYQPSIHHSRQLTGPKHFDMTLTRAKFDELTA